MANDASVFAQADRNRVAPIEDPEHRLQRVIAIRATADDPQEQIQLGRGRPYLPPGVYIVLAHCEANVQSSIASRTRASPDSASIFAGRSGAPVGPGRQAV